MRTCAISGLKHPHSADLAINCIRDLAGNGWTVFIRCLKCLDSLGDRNRVIPSVGLRVTGLNVGIGYR